MQKNQTDLQYSAEQVISIIDSWNKETLAFFYRQVSINLTISHRVIGEDKTLSDSDKLSEMTHLNEFHHKMLSWLNTDFDPLANDRSAAKLLGIMKFHADKMARRGAIEFPLASAFETTKGKLAEENN